MSVYFSHSIRINASLPTTNLMGAANWTATTPLRSDYQASSTTELYQQHNLVSYQLNTSTTGDATTTTYKLGKLPAKLVKFDVYHPQLRELPKLVQLWCRRTESHLLSVVRIAYNIQRNTFRQSYIWLKYAFYRLMSIVPAMRNASRINLDTLWSRASFN